MVTLVAFAILLAGPAAARAAVAQVVEDSTGELIVEVEGEDTAESSEIDAFLRAEPQGDLDETSFTLMELTLVDDSEALTAGAGCEQDDDPGQAVAVCDTDGFASGEFDRIVADLKGGDDAFLLTTTDCCTGDAFLRTLPVATEVRGGPGNDRISGGGGDSELFGGPGNDHLGGSVGVNLDTDAPEPIGPLEAGDDELHGGPGNDFLTPGRGEDVLHAGSGNDTIHFSRGADTVRRNRVAAPPVEAELASAGITGTGFALGQGLDVFEGVENLIGTAGPDVLEGDDADNGLVGGRGDDELIGNRGDDALWGNLHHDAIRAGSGDDVVLGNRGRDRLSGGSGRDLVLGNKDRDRISGGGGRDRLSGGGARDLVRGNRGGDRISGGGGRDRLAGGRGRDVVRGNKGGDRISGGGRRDRLFGNLGPDQLFARDGRRDHVNGGGGSHDRARVDARDDVVAVEMLR